MSVALKNLIIAWEKKSSVEKKLQIVILEKIIAALSPISIKQLKPINNFGKKVYSTTKKDNYIYFSEINNNKPNLLVKNNIFTFNIYFNHYLTSSSFQKDYFLPSTVLIQRTNNLICVTSKSDFSNEILRKRFRGYKYITDINQKIFINYGEITKFDRRFLINNRFHIVAVDEIQNKFSEIK